MKFHNQKSFMGHEISNVKNKPLLHKKGKQWIVVAISALVLAGFGGMVSTTTHADTTKAQPAAAKVAPKPANNSGNASDVMKQAQGMHQTLVNKTAVQKPSTPSSVATKKTTPASATSITSAKSSSVSASSSASSKASSSVNSASAKSSSTSSNSSSNNSNTTKPAVHMVGMGTPLLRSNPVTSGTWGTSNWTLSDGGTLTINGGDMKTAKHPEDLNAPAVKHIIVQNGAIAPVNSSCLFASSNYQEEGSGAQADFHNLQSVDLSGLVTSNVTDMAGLFHGDGYLTKVKFGNTFDTHNVTSMAEMFDDDCNIQSLNMSSFNTQNVNNYFQMFWNTPSIITLDLSNFDIKSGANVGEMFDMDKGNTPNEPNPRHQKLSGLVLNPSFSNINTNDADLNNDGIGHPANAHLIQQGIAQSTKYNNWSDVAHNAASNVDSKGKPEPAISSSMLQQYTVNFDDILNNSHQVSSTTITGVTGASDLSIADINIPPTSDGNYQIDYSGLANTGDTVPITSDGHGNKIAKVPVYEAYEINKQTGRKVPSSESISGTWGNCTWILSPNNSGKYNLVLTKGNVTAPYIDSNVPNLISKNITKIGSYVNHNVPMPSGFSLNWEPYNTFNLTPTRVTDTINYMNKGNVISSKTLTGNDYQANGASNTTLDAKSYAPAGYSVTGNTTINYDGRTHNVNVTPNTRDHVTIDYDWDGNSKGSYAASGLQGQTINITGSSLDSGWSVNPSANYGDTSNGQYTFGNPTYNNTGTVKIGISPNQVTDHIDYMSQNNSIVSSSTYTGNDVIASGANSTSFTVSAPTNYHLSSGVSSTLNYDGKTHKLAVNPNTVTVNYKYGRYNSTATTSYNGNKATYNDFAMPTGYQLSGQNRSPLSFSKNGSSVNVHITPIHETDTIYYQYNGQTKGSQKFSGNDYRASQAGSNSVDVTSANDTNIPTNYHLASANNQFKYDGSSHDIAIELNSATDNINFNNDLAANTRMTGSYGTNGFISAPSNYHYIDNDNGSFTYNGSNVSFNVAPNTITVNYVNNENNSVVSSNTVTYNSKSSIPNDFALPSNYNLAQSNGVLQFADENSTSNVAITPKQNTDTINYTNGGINIASDVYTGDVNASFNAINYGYNKHNYLPVGYHVANGSKNTFSFDGQTHNITVYPNSITLKFNHGQAGSKTINTPTETTYRIKNSDVPANYQLTNPSDDSIDLGNLGKSTDYNVDVTPISTPSVPSDNIQPAPFIPSYIAPVSSASSVSPENSVESDTSSTPTSEASTRTNKFNNPVVHYRYTKVIAPLQLHTSKHFTKKNGVLTIKHPASFKIMKVVHDHKLARYEVRYQGHNYFITANRYFTTNDYVQKHDFKSHKNMTVKVITPLIEYKHTHFNKKNAIKVFKKGAVLPIKKVLTIGKGEMTRFELTNGRYVTSNKLFVKVIE